MKTPIIDVVITFAGRVDFLEKCLNSIYRGATVPITINILDDASDKKKKLENSHLFQYNKNKDVHENVVSFRSKRNEKTEGFPRSANGGAKLSNSKIICFISDDVEIFPDYFDNLVKVLEDETIGIVGARLMFPLDSPTESRPAGKIQHVGVSVGFRGEANHPLLGWSSDNPKTMVSRECFAVTGALYTIRRDLFRAAGGFDLIFGRGYWEDVDMCLKVRQMGYRIWIDAGLNGYHYGGATLEIDQTHGSDFNKNAAIFRSRWEKLGLITPDTWTYG